MSVLLRHCCWSGKNARFWFGIELLISDRKTKEETAIGAFLRSRPTERRATTTTANFSVRLYSMHVSPHCETRKLGLMKGDSRINAATGTKMISHFELMRRNASAKHPARTRRLKGIRYAV